MGLPSDINILSTVTNYEGAIGYAEVADAVVLGSSSPIKYAKVNGKDPITSFKADFTLPTGTLLADQVLGADDPTTGRPTLAAISPASKHAGCVLIANPDDYATSASYPIVAISYLLGYYAGNGDDVANLRALFNAPMNRAIQSSTTTIGTDTGLAYLNGSEVSTTISNAIKACINK